MIVQYRIRTCMQQNMGPNVYKYRQIYRYTTSNIVSFILCFSAGSGWRWDMGEVEIVTEKDAALLVPDEVTDM